MPKKFTTTYINASFSRLPEAFNNYTIALVADLHNANFGGALEAQIALEKPDIIAIAGDFVSFHNHTQNGINFVKSAAQIAPVLYVNGNHECRFNEKNYSNFKQDIINAGAVALENDIYNITRKGATISVIGTNDQKSFLREKGSSKVFKFKNTLQQLSNSLPCDQFKILLTHRPQWYKFYASCNIDLSLACHAHGGQIRIPKLGALFADGLGFFSKYAQGHHIIGEQHHLIVSRGLGHTYRTPPRIFNKRELMIIKLKTF